jgi:glycine oxidase
MPDVIVVGGGLVGLATAFRLAETGRRVTVLERDRIVGAASRAAAAMIAPVGYIEPPDDAFLRLRIDGAARWPGFAALLADRTGTDPQLRTTGSLVAAMSPDELADLAALARFHAGLGIESHLLDPAAAGQVEPRLAGAIHGALHVPGEGCVDPERAGRALAEAITGLGGEVRENATVTALRTAAGRVTGVDTAAGTVHAPTVVLAAGAWSTDLPGVPPQARPALRPVRGQSVIVRGPLGVVVRAGINLVPRGDGRIMIAGTVEPGAGYRIEPTVAGIHHVLTEARRAVPAIADATVLGVAVGLRPVDGDDAPVLGPAPGVTGLWWATGHSYYGILLAPITADLLAAAIDGDAAGTARVRAFGVDRFVVGEPRYTSLRH